MYFHLINTNAGFHAKAENKRFTSADSRCRQNLDIENFTSSFVRLRQRNALAGLSKEAVFRRKSAGCQTTFCRLVLPGYQLKRNTLCLKSLKTCPRLQEIASKQLFVSKKFPGENGPRPPYFGGAEPKNARCAC